MEQNDQQNRDNVAPGADQQQGEFDNRPENERERGEAVGRQQEQGEAARQEQREGGNRQQQQGEVGANQQRGAQDG